MKLAAIFAHYDVDHIVDDNTLSILDILSDACATVDFITTSELDLSSVPFPENVSAVRRPNIGYDFYSYKTGLLKLLADEEVTHILLVNSSFFLVDPDRFREALSDIITRGKAFDAFGTTASHQLGWHMQSYLMMLGPGVLRQDWFADFVNDIQPQNSKIDLILNYEIGLSRLLQEQGAKASVLMDHLTSGAAAPDPNLGDPVQLNPIHVYAREIAEQFGIVKTEVLRDNQHEVDLDAIYALADSASCARLHTQVDRLKGRYQVGEDKMTSLASKTAGPPAYRIARLRMPRSRGVRVAVVIHMYYSDLAPEFYESLRNIIEPFDLYLTTPFEHEVPGLVNQFADLAASVNVSVSENRGRDIGPFIALLRDSEFDGYDAVLKLHSKKSRYSTLGDQWRQELVGSLVGTSLKAMKSINLLRNGAGIVGQQDGYLTDPRFWGANQPTVTRLLRETGSIGEDEDAELGFFAGSMFWFNPRALERLRHLSYAQLDFEPEQGVQDGSLAHAIERTFGPASRALGFKSTTIYLNGQEIHGIASKCNRVPVL